MTSEDLERLREHLRALMEVAPKDGGNMLIDRPKRAGDKTGIVCGDRIGLIRLGIALLHYAINAHLIEGSQEARAQILRDFYQEPTSTTSLLIQLDDTPIRVA